MRVESLAVQGFRNLAQVAITPAPAVNIIYGENGQGKTNLLEALWLFTGQKSFRRAGEAELLAFGGQRAVLGLEYFAQQRSQSAVITLGQGHGAQRNGVPLSGPGALRGSLPGVVFSPEHLALIKGGPSLRRRFLDEAISQLMPRYASLLTSLGRVLVQRAALLADMQRHSGLESMLDMWDEQLAKLAGSIIKARLRYCGLLTEHATRAYRGISGGREALSLVYTAGLENPEEQSDLTTACLQALANARSQDIRQAANTFGPHRDDLLLLLDDHPARQFASQGQQRSCALALKLAECDIAAAAMEEAPLVLLDDVLSELDSHRQAWLLSGLAGRQVFITCCEPAQAGAGGEAAVFRVEQGVVQQA